MEQQLRCTFRGPPSTVNVSDSQCLEDHLVDGYCLQNRSEVQTGVRISPRGAPVGLGKC